jgi:hypothetical protein
MFVVGGAQPALDARLRAIRTERRQQPASSRLSNSLIGLSRANASGVRGAATTANDDGGARFVVMHRAAVLPCRQQDWDSGTLAALTP